MSSRSLYIPLHGDVFSNRKTIAAANELTKGDIEKMVGHLARLWAWALERNDDGDLSHLTDQMIADAAGWRRRPSTFVQAITDAGFLEDRRLHDWDDYAGVLIARRKRDRERKKTGRTDTEHDGTIRGMSVEIPSPVRTQQSQAEPSEEKKLAGPSETYLARRLSAAFERLGCVDRVLLDRLLADDARVVIVEKVELLAEKPATSSASPSSRIRKYLEACEDTIAEERARVRSSRRGDETPEQIRERLRVGPARGIG